MKGYLKTAIVLILICGVAAILLGFLNNLTSPYIENYEQSKVMAALEEVSMGYDIGERNDIDFQYIEYAYPLRDNGVLKGYILGLISNGYGGEMKLAASFDLSGKILAVKMVSNSETPGVGKKSENPGYMNKFIGTGSSIPVPTKKSMLSDSDSADVSGASLTFTGISKALAAGSDYVRSL